MEPSTPVNTLRSKKEARPRRRNRRRYEDSENSPALGMEIPQDCDELRRSTLFTNCLPSCATTVRFAKWTSGKELPQAKRKWQNFAERTGLELELAFSNAQSSTLLMVPLKVVTFNPELESQSSYIAHGPVEGKGIAFEKIWNGW
ncbi:hypothetical protein R1flu_027661 [Riccia fluitans]|uniref:Uncharacterized protein n=1 Tax=Riccia fluitans TaxID=41844 RepID=A0ABD1XNH6_9MARC